MGTPKEGGNPLNIDPSTWRVAPDKSRFGSGFKKPEEPKQQPSDPNREAFERIRRKPYRPIVAGGESHIRTQRLLREAREREASQSNAAAKQEEEKPEELAENRKSLFQKLAKHLSRNHGQ
jgi:hypothetical protein